MYQIYFGTAVKKDLGKLPKNIRLKVDEIFFLLSKNPFLGEGLVGEFLGYYSYHFKNQKTEYRIIYNIKNK
jgi:mRNA-degrading endonuclease RelE of RelBE toxin-antitoxin system